MASLNKTIAWLYQMSSSWWSPEEYRLTVWEGQVVRWPTARVRWGKQQNIHAGDLLLLFFCPTGTEDWGIYGCGIINRYNEVREEISFQVLPPSDYLKMSPCADDQLYEMVRKIRKGKQGSDPERWTMYDMSFEHLEDLRLKIREHTGRPSPQDHRKA